MYNGSFVFEEAGIDVRVIVAVIAHLYMHYVLFTQPGLRGYCQLAKDTIHNTD